MVRRIASQVQQQVARLQRGGWFEKTSARPARPLPVWYEAALEYPPLPLPAKAPPQRPPDDHLSFRQGSTRRPLKAHPLEINYIEDRVRRQFFRDHPFETFRPATLVEGPNIEAANPITGTLWTRLRQRGRNPTAEDAVQYIVNLHKHHDTSLSDAYAAGVSQFRSLKAERETAKSVAVLEADALGAVWGKSEIEHSFEKELKGLATWERLAEFDQGVIASRKRWKMIADKHEGAQKWTHGEEYTRERKEGVRPGYAPAPMRALFTELQSSAGLVELAPPNEKQSPSVDDSAPKEHKTRQNKK
ncbi:hypothetical protein FISHEDRAFT_37386 [Fistulina hepatica ATCC 64428]|uniref:Small ribosomal subunit protein mS23 n=1 Tax=Fistulina hepatica ATCC 64428 TaxID=1128425 RepID=A0A0D7AHJ8_9AGAR|nr:hypothetical protein FISHEDRAFT_37386 [Fistulina hepatica ATCC 64428]